MAIGDDAAAAGMALVNGASVLAKDIDTEINRTRDFIAQRTSAVTPINKGGTGQTTVAAARNAFGLGNTSGALPVANGGTGGATASAARTALGITATNVPTTGSNVQADVDYLNAIKANLAGAVFSGDIYVPASSGAVSSYTVAYINGDGRVCRGVSALRYKKNVRNAGALGNVFPTPLREWQMRANGLEPANPTWRVGYIADELIGTDLERFVVFLDGEVESIDFIAMLMAQVSDLNARAVAQGELIASLAARVDALEAP